MSYPQPLRDRETITLRSRETLQIPLLARIIAIADSFDAMTSDRPYRKGMPTATALAEIERCADSQFDPVFAALFVQMFAEGTIQR